MIDSILQLHESRTRELRAQADADRLRRRLRRSAVRSRANRSSHTVVPGRASGSTRRAGEVWP